MSLVSNLQSEWGDENSLEFQEVNVVNVIAQLHKWLEGASLPHLGSHLEQLQDRIRNAALEAEADMTGEAPEMEEHIRGMWRVYQEMLALLDEIVAAYRASDFEAVDPRLARLDEASEALNLLYEELEAWLAAEVPRCPRCGATPPLPAAPAAPAQPARGRSRSGRPAGAPTYNKLSSCSRCHLEMLLPDLKGPGPTQTLMLPAEFKVVHDLYVDIVKGKTTLSDLLPALDPLREHLQAYADLTSAPLPVEEAVGVSLATMSRASRKGLDGIAILEGVPITRQTRDLHEGWRMIFECCAELQGQVPVLTKAAGLEPDQDRVLVERTLDTVHLSGEEP